MNRIDYSLSISLADSIKYLKFRELADITQVSEFKQFLKQWVLKQVLSKYSLLTQNFMVFCFWNEKLILAS